LPWLGNQVLQFPEGIFVRRELLFERLLYFAGSAPGNKQLEDGVLFIEQPCTSNRPDFSAPSNRGPDTRAAPATISARHRSVTGRDEEASRLSATVTTAVFLKTHDRLLPHWCSSLHTVRLQIPGIASQLGSLLNARITRSHNGRF